MSTLSELRSQVARDLRDPDHKTFLADHVDDLINAGIEEVSRVYPREVIAALAASTGTTTYDLTSIVTGRVVDIWRLELWRNSVFYMGIPRAADPDEGSQQGYDAYAEDLAIPVGVANAIVTATDELRVWGYAEYDQLGADAQQSQLDVSGEWAVRRYSRASAFELMQADRSQFAQWQAASQNTDVTTNQLTQMVALYRAEWDAYRGRLRRMRRT